jgi:anti-anti-sigma factor
MTLFKVDVHSKKVGFFIVSISGSLDSEHYLELEEKVLPIIEPATKVILLDLKELSYISSMGIGSLLKIKKAVEANQGKLMLANLQPQIKKVFDIIKALPAEIMFTSVEEADAYLSSIQKNQPEKG